MWRATHGSSRDTTRRTSPGPGIWTQSTGCWRKTAQNCRQWENFITHCNIIKAHYNSFIEVVIKSGLVNQLLSSNAHAQAAPRST